MEEVKIKREYKLSEIFTPKSGIIFVTVEVKLKREKI